MPLIGYARVSTEDQTPLPQSEALQSAGCAEIFEEHASGGKPEYRRASAISQKRSGRER
ncbi:recombinase family protein [Sulfitobacter sp. TBRI5]|uniref:recombinase family protein n=1 Tax=Sulfitobacter sp. TBRI5 TaxID=2989732 RepID=UPI003D9BB5D9